MNLKKFEFTSKDAPFIKRDITLRLVFTALFVALFVWQFVALVIAQSTNSISTAKLVATIFVLLTSLLMAMLGFVYAFKDIRILNAVKKRGSCVSTVDIIFSTKKHSFVRLYQIICQVLALVCLFVLLCSLTYAVLHHCVPHRAVLHPVRHDLHEGHPQGGFHRSENHCILPSHHRRGHRHRPAYGPADEGLLPGAVHLRPGI